MGHHALPACVVRQRAPTLKRRYCVLLRLCSSFVIFLLLFLFLTIYGITAISPRQGMFFVTLT